MRTIFRNIFLFVAVISSLLLTACGGGSSDPVIINNGGNPVSPKENLTNEALAVRDAVTPVLQNADAILNGGVANSLRFSTSGNTNELSSNEIGNAVIKTLEAPQLLRAVITAAGGNIKGGLWMNTADEINNTGYKVASFSNGVYERTVYYFNQEDLDKFHENNTTPTWLKDNIRAHYKIDGCTGDFDKENGILKSLTINPNAKILIEENDS